MKTLPVLTHFLIFERVTNEYMALDAWRRYVTAHGWSTVGEPWMEKVPEGHAVLGRVVKTDQPIPIAADATQVTYP